MIRYARRGLRVARVKGGDPFVFGRGGEECAALAAAGIVYAFAWRSADRSRHRLLLAGVVLSAGFSALVSMVLVLAPMAVKNLHDAAIGIHRSAGRREPVHALDVDLSGAGRARREREHPPVRRESAVIDAGRRKRHSYPR